MSTVVDGLGQTLEENCVWLSDNVWICGLIDDAVAWVLGIAEIDILDRKVTIDRSFRGQSFYDLQKRHLTCRSYQSGGFRTH